MTGRLTVEQIVSADGYAEGPAGPGDLAFFEAADFGDEARTDSDPAGLGERRLRADEVLAHPSGHVTLTYAVG